MDQGVKLNTLISPTPRLTVSGHNCVVSCITDYFFLVVPIAVTEAVERPVLFL